MNARREVKSRDTGWARRIAAFLARLGVQPNEISIFSVIFAIGSGVCLVYSASAGTGRAVLLLVMALFLILLRLLCSLFDGMVAIEHGLKTKSGVIFNDLPDRIADPVILVCAGYAGGGVSFCIELGWLAGLLSVLTAFVRVLAGASGATQHFSGPMAKQHRMTVISVALAAAAVGVKWGWHLHVIRIALAVIVLGCVITVWRRTARAIHELEAE